MELSTNTVTIPLRRLEEFESRMSKLAKRARKLGVIEPTWELKAVRTETHRVETKLNPITMESSREVKVRVADIEIVHQAVKLADWDLLAKIDPIAGGTFTINVVPGNDELANQISRDLDPLKCDHCNTRRRRNATFIVRHQDGTMKQVGRNCLKDFLGHVSPEHIAAMVSFMGELIKMGDSDDWGFGGMRFDPRTDLVMLLEATAAVVRVFGWVPRSQAQFSTPTADTVTTLLIGRGDHADRLRREVQVGDVDVERAEQVIGWVRGMGEQNSVFLNNLRAIFTVDEVDPKNFGFACSAISAFMRHLDRQAEIIRKRESHKNSRHVGEIKKRQVFDSLHVDSVRSFETDFGTTTLIKFTDKDGNLIVWFASGDKVDDFRLGAEVDLKATVTKHDEFRGEKQTVVNRGVILKQEGGEEDETR